MSSLAAVFSIDGDVNRHLYGKMILFWQWTVVASVVDVIFGIRLVGPDLEERVPRTSAQADTIVADTQTADTVVVANKRADLFTARNVPDSAFKVVVAGKEQTAGYRGGNRGDTAEDSLGAVEVELAIGANIKEAARGVVGTGNKGVAVGEELDGVDIGLVAGKGLDSLACANIPELGEGVAGTGNKRVLVGGVQANAHDIAKVVGELGDALASLNVPLDAGHVARGGEDAAVIDEAAAREVSGVARQLAGDAGRAIVLLVEVINGANIIETTAGDVVSAGGVSAGHDP